MNYWERKPLRQVVAQIRTGSTPSTKQPEFFDGEVPFFTPGDIGGDVFLISANRSITETAVRDGKAKIFGKDTLLVTCIGDIGRVGILQSRASANQQITALKFKQDIDVKYAYYWFCIHRAELQGLANQAVVPILNNERLQSIEFSYPPLAEQQRIADILSRADRLRRLRRFALEMSAGYLQAVFLEMFGDPVTNPMGWEVVKLGSQIKDIRYGTGSPPPYVEDGIPFIRATNIKGGRIEFAGMAYISEESANAIEKCRVSSGDLLVVRSGVNTGDCAVIPSHLDGAFAAYDLIVRVDYPLNHYYNNLINSCFGKAIIGPLSRRSGQPHLNAEQVKSMKFPVPSHDELTRFAIVVQNHERLRAQQREALRQAEQLFQGLLQAAFRGELTPPQA